MASPYQRYIHSLIATLSHNRNPKKEGALSPAHGPPSLIEHVLIIIPATIRQIITLALNDVGPYATVGRAHAPVIYLGMLDAKPGNPPHGSFPPDHRAHEVRVQADEREQKGARRPPEDSVKKVNASPRSAEPVGDSELRQ
jgi:hypothetical protein